MTLDAATLNNVKQLEILAVAMDYDLSDRAEPANINDADPDSFGELLAFADSYQGEAMPLPGDAEKFASELSIQLGMFTHMVADEFRVNGFTPAQIKSSGGQVYLQSSFDGKPVKLAFDQSNGSSGSLVSIPDMLKLASQAIETHGATSVSFQNQKMEAKMANGSLCLYAGSLSETYLTEAARVYAEHIGENPRVEVMSGGDIWIDPGTKSGDADSYSLNDYNARLGDQLTGGASTTDATASETTALLKEYATDSQNQYPYYDRLNAIRSAGKYAQAGTLTASQAHSVVMAGVNASHPDLVMEGITQLGNIPNDTAAVSVLSAIIKNSTDVNQVTAAIKALANLYVVSAEGSVTETKVHDAMSQIFYALQDETGRSTFACLRDLDDAQYATNAALIAQAFKDSEFHWG